jgi:hypothetical protein
MMKKLPDLARCCLLLLVGPLLAACATTANIDYRKGYDFSSIRSLRIREAQVPASMDPRVNSPLVDQRLRKAIAAWLAAHGYQVVSQGGDAGVSYRIGTRSGVESSDSGVSVGYGTFGRHTALGLGYGFPLYDVDTYDDAILTIDILGPRDDSLLWRGSASRRLGNGTTPEKLDELVNGLVGDVLDHFPPGGKH